MIEITDKSKCCGCEACVQRCPKQCITMKMDEEGFFYPSVDVTRCVDCGVCDKVCPFINQDNCRKPIDVFAAKNKNDKIRLDSSSGGIFSLLAQHIIYMGGVVFGAHFNDKWEVEHCYIENVDDIQFLRGSKYVQSRILNTFKEVECFLKNGRKVLFCGTPCQVAGLKKFLRKDYPNLILVDFICHGVPSPGVFSEYLNEELCIFSRKNKCNNIFSGQLIGRNTQDPNYIFSLNNWKIESISFRDKRIGWKKFCLTIKLSKLSKNEKKKFYVLSHPLNKNIFLRGFLKDLYLRPSCYDCAVKGLKSGSDITIGDYWGIAGILPDFDDDTGVSAVIVNTEKGEILFHSLENIDFHRTSYEHVAKNNLALEVSCKEPPERTEFYAMSNLKFNSRINRLCNISMKKRIYSFLMRRIGLFYRLIK